MVVETFKLTIGAPTGGVWPVAAEALTNNEVPTVSVWGRLALDVPALESQPDEAAYGAFLGRALFAGEVGTLFVAVLSRVTESLRVVLVIEDDRLRRLIWGRLRAPIAGRWVALARHPHIQFAPPLSDPVAAADPGLIALSHRFSAPPLERYLQFRDRLLKIGPRPDMAPEAYAAGMLWAIADALGARQVALARHNGHAWEIALAAGEEGAAAQRIGEPALGGMIAQAARRSAASVALSAPDHEPWLFVPCPGSHPRHILAVTGFRSGPPLDALVAAALETIVDLTEHFTGPIAPDLLEIAIADELRRRFGPMADGLRARQGQLFTRRLTDIHVRFAPVVYLHPREPYIWAWDTVGGDDPDHRVDLLSTAALWGDDLRLTLDMHLLETAAVSYIQGPNVQGVLTRLRRKEELQPLIVSLAAPSACSELCRDTLRRLYLDGRMPLNKLMLLVAEEPAADGAPPTDEGRQALARQLARLDSLDVAVGLDGFEGDDGALAHLRPAVVRIDRERAMARGGQAGVEQACDAGQAALSRPPVIVGGADLGNPRLIRWLYNRGLRYAQGWGAGAPAAETFRLHVDDRQRICGALGPAPLPADEPPLQEAPPI